MSAWRAAGVLCLVSCASPHEAPPATARTRAALTVSAEVALEPLLVYGAANDRQIDPRVAFDGTNFLVVWSDYRTRVVRPGILAARVTEQGSVLDPFGIVVVSQEGRSSTEPDVAFNGADYLVVWSDIRDSQTEHTTWSARVSPSGAVSPDQQLISAVSVDVSQPRVASNGSDWVVAAQRADGLTELRHVPSTGSPAEALRVTMMSSPVPYAVPTGWGLVGTQAGDLRFQRFTTNLMVIASASNLARPLAQVADEVVHSPGTGADLVIFKDHPTQLAVGGALIPAGADGPDAGFLIFADPPAPETSSAAVARDGGFIAVWQDFAGIHGTRIDDDAGVLDPGGFSICAPSVLSDSIAVAAGKSSVLIVSSQGLVSSNVLACSLTAVPPPGQVPIQNLTRSAHQQVDSFTAQGPGGAVVAWEQGLAGTEIHAALLGTAGELTVPGFAVSSGNGTSFNPTVAASDSEYLVAWDDHSNGATIFAQRLGLDGGLIGPRTAASTSPEGDRFTATVVAVDGGWLLSWHDTRDGGNLIFGAALDARGNLVAPDGPIFDVRATTVGDTGAASTFNQALVVWADNRNGDLDVWAARVRPDGVVLDPDGFLVAGGAGLQRSTTVTSDGQRYRVCWLGASDTDESAFVDTAGNVAPGPARRVVAWTGSAFAGFARLSDGGLAVDLELDDGGLDHLELPVSGERYSFGDGFERLTLAFQRTVADAGHVFRLFGVQLDFGTDAGRPGGGAGGGAGGGSAGGGSAGGGTVGGQGVYTVGCACDSGGLTLAALALVALTVARRARRAA